MSLAADALSELALAAQPAAAGSTGKQPKTRIAVAKADGVAQPEPR